MPGAKWVTGPHLNSEEDSELWHPLKLINTKVGMCKRPIEYENALYFMFSWGLNRHAGVYTNENM